MSLTLSEQLKREQLSYPQTLLHHLQKLRHFVTVEGEEKLQQWKNLIEKENFQPSTRNLAYYLALRQEYPGFTISFNALGIIFPRPD